MFRWRKPATAWATGFASGDVPRRHHRTTYFVKGKTGVVNRYFGKYKNPENLAYGGDGLPLRELYWVEFEINDLWEHEAGKNRTNSISKYMNIGWNRSKRIHRFPRERGAHHGALTRSPQRRTCSPSRRPSPHLQPGPWGAQRADAVRRRLPRRSRDPGRARSGLLPGAP